MAAHTSRQFASVSEEEFLDISLCSEESQSQNTKKLTKLSTKIFREYLIHKGLDPDFEKLEMDELDRLLAMFYVELRNSKGEMYKKTTLISYRHGLQRYLQSFRPEIDIFKGPAFKESNKAFKGVAIEMKRLGNASIEHHPVIHEKDIQKMCRYLTSSDNPHVLQHKVFIDISIHFGCRGRQNLRGLKRSDFTIVQDEEGSLYVEKIKDEEGKDDEDQSESRMYGIKGSIYCPVTSFVNYFQRLNPECEYLFQQPRRESNTTSFYNNAVLGHNRLGNMMCTISQSASLSRRYSNHSLRVSASQIMDWIRKASNANNSTLTVDNIMAGNHIMIIHNGMPVTNSMVGSNIVTLNNTLAPKSGITVNTPIAPKRTTAESSSCAAKAVTAVGNSWTPNNIITITNTMAKSSSVMHVEDSLGAKNSMCVNRIPVVIPKSIMAIDDSIAANNIMSVDDIKQEPPEVVQENLVNDYHGNVQHSDGHETCQSAVHSEKNEVARLKEELAEVKRERDSLKKELESYKTKIHAFVDDAIRKIDANAIQTNLNDKILKLILTQALEEGQCND